MEEFHIVLLGAFVAKWKRVCSSETRWCALAVDLHAACRRLGGKVGPWSEEFAEPSSRVTESSGHLQAQYLKLHKLRSRWCQGFLHSQDDSPPAFFALEYVHILIRALRSNEERVELLRHAAKSRKSIGRNVIIRYKSGMNYYYASIIPHECTSRERSAEQCEISNTGHQRSAIGRIR
jgi:hypothetical protein